MAEWLAEVIHDRPDIPVHMFANTTALSAANLQRIKDAYKRRFGGELPRFEQWVGFDAKDAKGEWHCKFHAEADLLNKLGQSPYRLCRSNETGEICRFAETCPIFAQQISQSPRWVGAHELLAADMRNETISAAPVEVLVIDEDPTKALLDEHKMHLDTIREAVGLTDRTQEAVDAAVARIDARFEGRKERVSLREGGTVRRLSGRQVIETVVRIYIHLTAFAADGTRPQWSEVFPNLKEVTEQLRDMVTKRPGRPNPDRIKGYRAKLKHAVSLDYQLALLVKMLDFLHECCRIGPGPSGELAGVRLGIWKNKHTLFAYRLQPLHERYRGALISFLSATIDQRLIPPLAPL